MAKQNYLLAQKVNYIFTILCQKDRRELAKLLSDLRKVADNPAYEANREKSLMRIIESGTARFADFYKSYDAMRIASLEIDGVPLFSKNFFFESSLEAFEERLQAYIEQMRGQITGLDASYRHLYFYGGKDNDGTVQIEHYEVVYENSVTSACSEGSALRLLPAGAYEAYEGCVQREGARILFTLSNNHDTLAILFNKALLSGSVEPLFDEALYGAAVGIEDLNRQVVVSKKVVLMKKALSEEACRRLYLVLNETQMFDVRENLYAMQSDNPRLESSYLATYRQKILDMHYFFSTLKYSESIATQIPDHLIFAEYHAFSMLYDKYAQNRDFFLTSRKRIVLELLRYLKINGTKEMEVQMVLPLYDKQENIFLYQMAGKESIFDLLLRRAEEGVRFRIVFVVEKPQEYRNAYMEGVFAQLVEADVSICFVEKEVARGQMPGSDFFYISGASYAVIRDLPGHEGLFTVTARQELIRSCMQSFSSLEEMAYAYEEILEESCLLGVTNDLLASLIGKWYGYFYGSVTDADGKQVLWEPVFTVANDATVIEKRQGVSGSASGRVDTGTRQTQFVMQNSLTENSYYLIFDNSDVAEIFSALLVSTGIGTDTRVVSMGILSRKPMEPELIETLMPDASRLTYSMGEQLQKKIRALLGQREVSSLIHSR